MCNLKTILTVCNSRDAAVHSSLTPIHDHVDLSTKNRIRRIQFFASLVVNTEPTHDSTTFPDGTIIAIELKCRASMTWIHCNEFFGPSFTESIDNFNLIFNLKMTNYCNTALRIGR